MPNIDELDFKGSNPGAVKHGNFINYYQFHPPDLRIKLLPTDIWDDLDEIICLDIGCNAGDLTVALYEHFTKNICRKFQILGVDIDPILIERANEKIKNIENVTFKRLDFTKDEERNRILDGYLRDYCKTKFDIVFCFSITMWIHLNNGDEGLTNFIYNICEISKILVIEPQPWKCYRTAIKRMKKSGEVFPNYKELKIRDNVESEIEKIILGKNVVKVKEIFEEKWERKLQIFKIQLV